MMAVWDTRILILPLLTLHTAWLFPQASFEVAVKCWWRRVSSVSPNVSIECKVDPHEATVECNLCHQNVLSFKPSAQFSQTGCSHVSASFTALLDVREMQNAGCTLLCPGHTTLPCMIQEGYPPPTCLIPFYDDERNIHCNWTGSRNALIPTNFTLQWRDVMENGYKGYIDVGGGTSGIIPRAKYPAHEYIKVWISATNILGKLESETLIINTQSIFQPAPPLIISHTSEPLEISWDVPNEAEHFEQWQCKVQYKKQCDQDWTEVEDTYEVSFILEDAVPFTTYKFRVRCRRDSDQRTVMSDWSSEYTAETPVAAPVGVLDVWSDCDSSSDESRCNVLWKEMPKQQARGNINGYVVTMKLSNGSVLNINGSVYTSSETCTQCQRGAVTNEAPNLVSQAQPSYHRCPQEQEQSCFHYCHLRVPVKEVTCIIVSANTASGRSTPAFVALPRSGPAQPAVTLAVRGKSQELHVSWSSSSDHNQEYVVQYIPVGRPHTQCLNWVKVHKNQTFVTLRGQLSDYTAYNVSLFAVVNNHSRLLKSAIAYTVEGVPPIVTDFQAKPTSPSSVDLSWTPIPLNISQGHIMQYLVGINNNGLVHKLDGNQSSLQISNLIPNQQYEVWVSAKTSAGEGNKTTTCFTTTTNGLFPSKGAYFFICFPIIILCIIVIVIELKKNKCKIPDPKNSISFSQLNNQSWQSWLVPSPSMEHGLTISQVEVIPEPVVDYESEVGHPEEHREHVQSGNKELQEYGGLEQNNSTLCCHKEYSQMIDDNDEEGRQHIDEEWNEEPFSSDYEKHFLPCVVDL